MSAARDPYLDLPLHGVRLIEASAGTGKTYTLATLVVRLVVERGLGLGQILAVTFTEAATQELRKRIRERLQLALDLIDAPVADDEAPVVFLTRELLRAHRERSGESDDALRRRLRQATLDIDLAAIVTIHGFCARVLREHALESGQAFDAPELLTDDSGLREALAADLWRAHASDDAAADDLAALWPAGHAALAADLKALMREPVLLPPDTVLPPPPTAALQAAARALMHAFAAHGTEFRSALLAALDAKVLHGQSYKADWIHALFDAAAQWCATGDTAALFEHPKLVNLHRDVLLARTNAKGAGQTPESSLCDAVPAYLEARQAQADYITARRMALLHSLRDDARTRVALRKRQLRVQTYDDLIDGVADALAGPNGAALARNLRAQYAVALADEFQDTDARQWAIFEEVLGARAVGAAPEATDPPDDEHPAFDRHPCEGRDPASLTFKARKTLDPRLRGDDEFTVSAPSLLSSPRTRTSAQRAERPQAGPEGASEASHPPSSTFGNATTLDFRVRGDDEAASPASSISEEPKTLGPCLRRGDELSSPTPQFPSSPRKRGPMDVASSNPHAQQNSDAPPPALFLIGDPKQAIYGFRGGDVHTYLDAARIAQAAPPLSHNFRSRPALLRAAEALYAQAGEDSFIDTRIRFRSVQPGDTRSDADYQRNGTAAAPLTIWQAPAPTGMDAKNKPKTTWSAGEARTLATQACVAAIHGVLSDARAGNAHIDGAAVQPGDIAVLVRSHSEATLIQQALAQAGIPAVAAGKQSLFATAEARELHALLLALLHTGDDGRLRTALCSVLIGVDAAGIDALDTDAAAHRHWQQQAIAWRERALRGGPLALIHDLCAAHAPRLLGLFDGERRISNTLQLAELLQEAQAGAPGLHGLVEWLGRRIATADAEDDTQLLRLESDARRVQIVTLHKSKGLEYPLVFLPFVGIGRRAASPGRHCIAHDATHGRRLHWKSDLPAAQWETAKLAWQAEQRAEDARLLYVGLTRAEHALWLATGAFFAHDNTPLSAMLRDRNASIAAGIVFDDTPAPTALQRLPAESDTHVSPARTAKPLPPQDWWVHSFSQLARADAGIEAASAATLPTSGGNDEPALEGEGTPDAAFDTRFAGNRYGVALHAALEHADFAAWSQWREGAAAPQDETATIERALRDEGYAADAIDDGIALTAQLIGHTLTVALPEDVRLCDVPADERRAEIEFQFAMQPVQVDALLRLLHAYGVVRDRHGFGLRQRLEGLMTGLIDLTYRHEGRWYVLDYKSNRLPAYDRASLQRAMAHSEYDLQALIYTLALHRWLRFRMRDAYDYARDFGGIRYLFCRGLDAARTDSPGIHAERFEPELVHALDALFGGTASTSPTTEKPLSLRGDEARLRAIGARAEERPSATREGGGAGRDEEPTEQGAPPT
jgi:ATP-dependent exoDNAse (exonuclease V) beta subunit